MDDVTFFFQVLSRSYQITQLDELFPEAFVVLLSFGNLFFVCPQPLKEHV